MSYDSPSFALPELTPAVKRLLLVNAAVFVLNIVFGGRLSENAVGGGGAWLAFSWPHLLDGYGLGALRLLSYQFTHAWSDIGHIFWNMLTLYFFGTMAERSLGYRGTFKLYVLGGFAAAVLHLLVAFLGGYEDVPLVGASGACYAFLVYAACMAPRAQVILIIVPVQLAWLAGALVFMGAYATYVEFTRGFASGTAHSAHLGGAAFGFVAHRLGWLRDYTPYAYQKGLFAGLVLRLRQWQQQRRDADTVATEAEVDRILDKVHREGITSLSSTERRVLERASKRSRPK